MDERELSATEQRVCDAFPHGRWVDLRQAGDRVVRAEVLRHLLLGGDPAAAGQLASLRLRGALITGHLNLSYADSEIAISLRECHFETFVDLYGSRLRRLNLRGSTLAARRKARARPLNMLSAI